MSKSLNKKLKESEKKMKDLLKGRGNNSRLKKMSEESMSVKSIENKIKDIKDDHYNQKTFKKKELNENHDNESGPCKCGAWHSSEAQLFKPSDLEILEGLNNELSEYKILYKKAKTLLTIKNKKLPSKLNITNAKEVLFIWKSELHLIQDELLKLNNLDANRLHKNISDSADGTFSYLDYL